MRRHIHSLVAATMLATAACHHRAHPNELPAKNLPVITRADIEKAHARTALDAVQRYRSDVLIARAPSSILLSKHVRPVVFLNDQYYGAVDELRQIPAMEVEEIRILSGPDAVQKFGSQYGGGVIQIISRVS